MGKIVVTTNVSLDGVVEDPDGKESFKLGGVRPTWEDGPLQKTAA